MSISRKMPDGQLSNRSPFNVISNSYGDPDQSIDEVEALVASSVFTASLGGSNATFTATQGSGSETTAASNVENHKECDWTTVPAIAAGERKRVQFASSAPTGALTNEAAASECSLKYPPTSTGFEAPRARLPVKAQRTSAELDAVQALLMLYPQSPNPEVAQKPRDASDEAADLSTSNPVPAKAKKGRKKAPRLTCVKNQRGKKARERAQAPAQSEGAAAADHPAQSGSIAVEQRVKIPAKANRPMNHRSRDAARVQAPSEAAPAAATDAEENKGKQRAKDLSSTEPTPTNLRRSKRIEDKKLGTKPHEEAVPSQPTRCARRKVVDSSTRKLKGPTPSTKSDAPVETRGMKRQRSEEPETSEEQARAAQKRPRLSPSESPQPGPIASSSRVILDQPAPVAPPQQNSDDVAMLEGGSQDEEAPSYGHGTQRPAPPVIFNLAGPSTAQDNIPAAAVNNEVALLRNEQRPANAPLPPAQLQPQRPGPGDLIRRRLLQAACSVPVINPLKFDGF